MIGGKISQSRGTVIHEHGRHREKEKGLKDGKFRGDKKKGLKDNKLRGDKKKVLKDGKLGEKAKARVDKEIMREYYRRPESP